MKTAKTALYCPKCGHQTIEEDVTGNGGELFVGEDSEVYTNLVDHVYKCKAKACKTVFFLEV